MHSFELFVNSLQSAIVNSTESINSRNEKILEDYFEREVNEIIIDNKNYDTNLFNLIHPIRNSRVFNEFSQKKQLEEALNSTSDSNLGEDQLLIDFLFDSYKYTLVFYKNFLKKNRSRKKVDMDVAQSIINYYNSFNNELINLKHNSLKSYSFYNENYYDSLFVDETNLNLANKEIESKKKKISVLEGELGKKNLIETITNLDNQQLKLNILREELKELTDNKSVLQTSIELKKKDLSEYFKELNEIFIASVNFVNFSISFTGFTPPKDAKNIKDKFLNEIVLLLNNSTRYIKKTIESLVPKTVRVNYPSTFDYATPDNNREYKTITTPVEVPLITLVPISNYNIEKAIFTANFKFDVDDDKVMVDFSKHQAIENEQISNFGKLEIVLSPQQTPEGLRSLIESYENFLKRQIV